MNNIESEKLATQIEGDIIALLDDFHSLPEVWDDEVSKKLMQQYIDVTKTWPERPYFSPSSTNSCPRELYIKAKRGKRDSSRRQPHQARWQRIGTAIGDIIQEDFLKIEKHYEKLTGNAPRFKFERNANGTPRFEEFATTNKLIEHNGEKFHLYGSPDGIMTYTTDEGKQIRVGLEIKSKQTTPARTSEYSMRAPDESHAKQCVAYSAMYDCDFYVVLYVNAAKKSWNVSDEDYAKTPDIRAFCLHITDSDRNSLFDKQAEITKAVRDHNPPKLDIEKFTFNNFKYACAKDLSKEEYVEISSYVKAVKHSSMPDWKKRSIEKDFDYITYVHGGGIS